MDADTKWRARTRLVLTIHFWLTPGLNIHRDDSVPTMCTDGRFIKWNGIVIGTQKKSSALLLARFCTLHSSICYGAVNVTLSWNIACDAINHILLDGNLGLTHSSRV